MSILSFPDRGPWGRADWPGNCSGHVYKDLLERLKPSLFVDPMCGSGTSIEVARELGIEAVGLDLHSGFNVLTDSILNQVGRPAELVLSHPPYGSMIVYSGKVWGQPHPGDLSRCVDDNEFNEKLALALLNQREATAAGGVYGTIIGDYRRNGVYTSYQAEAIARMPSDELLAVLIKAQHNTTSSRKRYGAMELPYIMHEYVLLWRRKHRTTLALLGMLATTHAERLRGTWRNIIRNVMIALGGQATLSQVYECVSNGCPERVKANTNWQAKVRQVLNSSGEYRSVERGIWAIA